MLVRHLAFEEKELTQNTPPFQAQHWKILLTIRGSLEKTTCIQLIWHTGHFQIIIHSLTHHYLLLVTIIFPAPTVLSMFSQCQ